MQNNYSDREINQLLVSLREAVDAELMTQVYQNGWNSGSDTLYKKAYDVISFLKEQKCS